MTLAPPLLTFIESTLGPQKEFRPRPTICKEGTTHKPLISQEKKTIDF